MCIYKEMIIIRNRWKSFNARNHWWQERQSFIDDHTDGLLLLCRTKKKVDCHLVLFTRSKQKNSQRFDLLENNDSCDTWIYCFPDKKTSCKTREEHISYQFTSDRSFFFCNESFSFISIDVLMNRFLVCTNTKVKINKRININCCYSKEMCVSMLSSAQLSPIRRKQHVVSRISVCCWCKRVRKDGEKKK